MNWLQYKECSCCLHYDFYIQLKKKKKKATSIFSKSYMVCKWQNCKTTLFTCGQRLPQSTSLYCIIISNISGALTDMLPIF